MSNRETVFRSRKFSVERCRFTAGSGEHVYDVVVHPGAAVVLPLLDDGRVLLIGNYRVAVGAELLELPAGTVDSGEDPLACAARELTEETGYRAARVEPLATFYSSPGVLNETMHAFVASELTAGQAAPEPGEQLRNVPMTWEEALTGIRLGRIRDAKTMVSLLHYDRFVQHTVS